jgi:RNA polymerase sigma-70 factor (ECF subfamily)
MQRTPGSLIERLRNRADDEAWTQFVKLYTPLLLYWARRLDLQASDAADLVQDVLLLLYQKLPGFSYDPQHSFRAWLRTVMVNKWREKHRRRTGPGLEPGIGALSEAAAPDAVAAFGEAEHRQYLVHRALQLMQTDFQTATWKAFWEHVVAGRPAADVARELGLTVKAVYLGKARVLRRLRQDLDGLMD